MTAAPSPAATLGVRDAAARRWDAIVVGAGPGGATAAASLAQRGARTLLVDKQSFPRSKVCGCCLNEAAIGALRDSGLGGVLAGAVPLHVVRVWSGRQCATLPLPGGAALSRDLFDARLVRAAVDAGAEFVHRTTARLAPPGVGERRVHLVHDGVETVAAAGAVIVADGLAGSALRDWPAFAARVSPAARLGAGVMLSAAVDGYEPGVIHMVVGPRGYLGLVRVEDGRLNLAAALDAAAVRDCGIAACAANLLRRAGLPIPADMAGARWRGTPPLTRSRRLAACDGVFLVGDAHGYVEPFTGEGMAWAIRAGLRVADVVHAAPARASTTRSGAASDSAAAWRLQSSRLLGRRRLACWALTRALRREAWVRVGVSVLHWAPALAGGWIRAINRARDASARST